MRRWIEPILFVIVTLVAVHQGLALRAESKDSITWSTKGVHLELIATSDDGDVKYYRLVDSTQQCYIVIGELHGKTVTMDCLSAEAPNQTPTLI
jgi:hypothetical protein